MKIVISPLDGNFARFANQIGALGTAKAHKALARAVNRTTNTAYGRVVKAIRKQSDIPTSIIRKQVKKRTVSTNIEHGGSLEGVIWATGKPLSLKYFKARQFSFGVKAKHGGQWHRYPSAFMGPKPGVVNFKRLGGHVYVRTSGNRFPIEKLFGPSIPEELIRGESERVFRETVSEMLQKRVAHELGRLLK
ncbi:hypothetical protein ACQZ46_00745 [Agrobacterium salinitolerans]